jgi:hypothetical protein
MEAQTLRAMTARLSSLNEVMPAKTQQVKTYRMRNQIGAVKGKKVC